MKRTIGMVSIGTRPWLGLTLPSIRKYAEYCRADVRILNFCPPSSQFAFPKLSEKPGWRNKAVYALKVWWPAQLLSTYDRVLLIDDTCIVTNTTPDLFALHEEGSVSAAVEPSLRSPEAHATANGVIRGLLEKIGSRAAGCGNSFNSGVMLFDKASAGFLKDNDIIDGASLLYSPFVDQTLFHHLLIGNLPVRLISEEFNFLNIFEGERKQADIFVSPLGKAYIYHVTSWWAQRRFDLIRALTRRLTFSGRL